VAETPKASVFELHIRAVLNEETRRQISSNTKHALAAAKARGVILGAPQRYCQQYNKKVQSNTNKMCMLTTSA
jgi:DNA invertase Pin-like site-specific DNA recombinase